MQVTTVGVDLAKNVFQVHGITKDGEVVFNRAIRRAQLLAFFEDLPACLVGMEACGSSHYWARQLSALGHEVRLIPANYVKPYVKRGSEADQEMIWGIIFLPNRCGRCGGNLRSRDTPYDAVRRDQVGRAAGRPVPAPGP